jgi:7-carboxy-7-deazaguanine synthase
LSNLRITEIFHSLQGEALTSGRPTVFVRLTGCPLRCQYCDTEYAFHGGEQKSIEDICLEVAAFKPRYITVTGGGPLAKPNCLLLLRALCDAGYQVSLETSGALDVSGVDERVSIVLDLKTPGSGEVHRNLYQNINLLKPIDQVKFVICDRQDFEWARFKVSEYDLIGKTPEVLFSASHESLPAVELANWIVEANLDVRMQLQMHKYLWGDKPGV